MIRSPINHSIGCYVYRCRNSFDNVSPTRSRYLVIEETHEAAGKAGWVMGHLDGQAHYACPECAGGLFDEQPLRGMFTKRQLKTLRARVESA